MTHEDAGRSRATYWTKVRIMREEGQIPIEDDRAALDYAYSGAERTLIITRDDTEASRWERLWPPQTLYLLDIVNPDKAAALLDRISGLDLVWVELEDNPVPEALVARLQLMTARGSIRLVWVAHGAALDQGYAAFDSDHVIFLARPSDMDRTVTAAIMGSRHKFALHDSKNESEAAQIHKLTEEVNRIAKTLAQMAERRGGADANGLPDAQDNPDNKVRSPATSYVAEPPLSGNGFGASAAPAPGVTADDVRQVIRIRRMRDQFFPSEIFADPAWDMLLDLMAARLSGANVSVSSLCIAAAVPATTALRWIRTMTDAGLFVRHADPDDGRRVYIGLSDEAATGMMRYFSAIKGRTSFSD